MSIEVQVEPQQKGLRLRAKAEIDAEVGTAWRILTDYARYPEFVPGIRDCRVVRHDGARVTVEQTGNAYIGLASVPFHAVYEIREHAPDEVSSSAEITGAGRLDSHYRLTQRDVRVVLEYSGTLAPRTAILLPLEEAVAQQTIVRQFRALAERIEREHRRHGKPQEVSGVVHVEPLDDRPRRAGGVNGQ